MNPGALCLHKLKGCSRRGRGPDTDLTVSGFTVSREGTRTYSHTLGIPACWPGGRRLWCSRSGRVPREGFRARVRRLVQGLTRGRP